MSIKNPKKTTQEVLAPEVHCAHTRMADPRTLKAHPRNPNRHPKEQIVLLGKVIGGFAGKDGAWAPGNGWRAAIVVSKRSGLVVKGHARLEAALLRGWDQVPVDEQEYATENDEVADLVADNKIAELAESDDAAIAKMLAEFGGEESRFGLLADDEDDGDGVHEIEIKPPPRMAWVLIGCRIEQFGQVQSFVENLPNDFHVSTTTSDQGAPEEGAG